MKTLLSLIVSIIFCAFSINAQVSYGPQNPQVFFPASTSTNSGSGGSGTVTSVTFTGDGVISSNTASTAVTTSGTLTNALRAYGPNLIVASPTSGTGFIIVRSLATADLYNLMNNSANTATAYGVPATGPAFPWVSAGAATLTTNVVNLQLFTVYWPTLFSEADAFVSTTQAGAHLGLSIYATNGTLLLDSGPIAVSGTGVIKAPYITPTVLSPGVYYRGWSCDGATASFTVYNNGTQPIIGMNILNATWPYFIGSGATASIAGQNPNNFGAFTTNSALRPLSVGDK